VYKDNKLIKSYVKDEQTSEILPIIFKNIMEKFTLDKLFFARGPGSFMAIKVTYIFLRTLSIAKNLKLFATDGFYFNQNNPIKAMGKLYFVKKENKIETKVFNDTKIVEFNLPKELHVEDFTQKVEPLYILPAV
jgi:tRNA A37 threonylcarbamoyladenosine modification protein TsaB